MLRMEGDIINGKDYRLVLVGRSGVTSMTLE